MFCGYHKKMKSFLKNSSGFSMVQGLIVAGIVAASSLVTTRLMNDQKKAQKATEFKDKIDELHKTLYSTLQNRLSCKETVLRNGKNLEIVSNLEVQLARIYNYSLSGCNPLDVNSCLVAESGGYYMNRTILLKNMTLSAPTGGVRTLKITYRKFADNSKTSGKRSYGGLDIIKTIPIRIQKNPSNNSFISCYAFTQVGTAINGVNSQEMGNDVTKEMCNDMVTGAGQKIFTWDDNKSLCVPNAKCPYGQIYTGIDQDGTVKCRFIRDWMDFNEVLDASGALCPINSRVGFVINQVTKKVKISCGVCASSCDCPNSTDVCESGVCVNRATGCINGTYNRGDSICQGYCMGGNWVCPVNPPVCP
jgi:hypothetical protein